MKYIVLLLTAVITLGSCSNGANTKLEESPLTPKGEVKKIELGENPFTNVSKTYLQNEQFLQCSQEAVDMCIMSSIGINESLTLEKCDDLFMQSNRDSCKQSIITTQARESGDITLCDTTSDPDTCKYELLVTQGISEKDATVCNTLSETLEPLCNNTVIRTILYDTLDEKLCSQLVVEIEGDDINNIQEQCSLEIEAAKEIQAEIEKEQEAAEALMQKEQEANEAAAQEQVTAELLEIETAGGQVDEINPEEAPVQDDVLPSAEVLLEEAPLENTDI